MLSTFRKAYLFHYLLGLGFIIVCWLPTFLISQETVTSEVFNSDAVLKMGFSNVYLLNLLGLIVTIISALILNHLATEYGITGKLMTMGIFFYAVLSVSLSPFTMMNPYIVINFFLFFFIRNIYRLPSAENPIPLIFNSSLMLGLASLYFLNIILLTVIIWLGLILHRASSWRNFMASIIGVIVPYLFILTWYYWSDQLQDYILILSERSFFTFNTIISIGIPDLIISIGISFFIILGVLKTFVSLGEKNINLRRNLIITIYFLIFITIIFSLFATGLNSALLFVVPAALILSNAFHNIRNYRVYNIVFAILTVFIMVNQYLKFFI